MASPKNHCDCGELKKAKASCCWTCWKRRAKEEAAPPSRCACGATKRTGASSCRACWLAEERPHPKQLCSCGNRKAKKSARCRKCWFQSLAEKALFSRQQPERCCTRCCKVLPVSAFVKDGEHRTSWCKICQRAYRQTRAGFWIKLRHRLRKQFGATIDDYMTLWNLQGGRCATCLERLEFRDKTTHLDHCHRTGQVRGLLCRGCNQAAGCVKDSSGTLRRLADYLEQHTGIDHPAMLR